LHFCVGDLRKPLGVNEFLQHLFHSRAGGQEGRSPNHTWAPSHPPRSVPHREQWKPTRTRRSPCPRGFDLVAGVTRKSTASSAYLRHQSFGRYSDEIDGLTWACAEPHVRQSLLIGALQWSHGSIRSIKRLQRLVICIVHIHAHLHLQGHLLIPLRIPLDALLPVHYGRHIDDDLIHLHHRLHFRVFVPILPIHLDGLFMSSTSESL
jgi:hypothetical protein